jgi:hypothetical protein
MYTDVYEKVSSLEAILGEFIVQNRMIINRLDRESKESKEEMKEFKSEMKEFKDEMKEFKDEMKEFKDEMKEFKEEMKEFKNEMGLFKINLEKDRKREAKQWNKKWGNLANKMGTIVEDIISPAVRPVVEKYFNCKVYYKTLNTRKRDNHLDITGEFDVIAASEEFVFLVEAKSTPSEEYIDKFIKNIEKFKKLFPEFTEKKLIPIFASLRFDNELIAYASHKLIYIMAYKEWDYMDLLNFNILNQIEKAK